jgi:hypothetical protein
MYIYIKANFPSKFPLLQVGQRLSAHTLDLPQLAESAVCPEGCMADAKDPWDNAGMPGEILGERTIYHEYTRNFRIYIIIIIIIYIYEKFYGFSKKNPKWYPYGIPIHEKF